MPTRIRSEQLRPKEREDVERAAPEKRTPQAMQPQEKTATRKVAEALITLPADKPVLSDPAAVSTTLKRSVGEAAAQLVRHGDSVGFGTGSTAKFFTAAVGARKLTLAPGAPTSEATRAQAEALGLTLTPWNAKTPLTWVVDGADELVIAGKESFAIKGGGGAMLRERAVAERGKTYVLIVDEAKLSQKLGSKFPLPVEVHPSAVEGELTFLRTQGEPILRMKDGAPFVTDNGNFIIDVRFPNGIADPKALARMLDARPHVAAHGLFINMAHTVLVGRATGVQRIDLRP